MKTAWITCLALLTACGLQAIEADIDDVTEGTATADEKAERAINDAGRAQTRADDAHDLADDAKSDALKALEDAGDAAMVANRAEGKADGALETANAAQADADEAIATVDDLETRMDSGEFVGEPGRPGDRGADGANGTNGTNGKNGVPQSKTDIDNIVGTSRTTLGTSGIWAVTASCKDTRDLAMTGGCEYTSSSKTCYNVQLVGSGARYNTNSSNKAGWTCSYVNEGTLGGNACTVRAYVNCIDL